MIHLMLTIVIFVTRFSEYVLDPKSIPPGATGVRHTSISGSGLILIKVPIEPPVENQMAVIAWRAIVRKSSSSSSKSSSK
jgi:hypothetical protein